MEPLRVFSPLMLLAIWELLLTTIRAKCEPWTAYEKIYSDKLCWADYTDHGYLVTNLILCLVSCSSTADCGSLIYNKQNATCYKSRSTTYHGDCSTGLIGSWLYEKVRCPIGWKFVDKSCYRITNEIHNQAGHAAICENLGNKTHLADLKLSAEYVKVREWLRNQPVEEIQKLFLGARDDNGWKWSDGTQVRYIWAMNNNINNPVNHRCVAIGPSGLFFIHCLQKETGLCEMDMLL